MIITKRKILKTALLPEYLPRIKQLFGTGFGSLSFLIAIVYNTVRILPDNHPYLNSHKKGQFTIRQVIAEAANHIAFKKENIDQIIVFFAIISALIIFIMQMFLLAISLFITPSFAQALPAKFNNVLNFFQTPNPTNDVAFQLMNLVFGIPGIFAGGAGITEPVHTALHSLFNFYSYGMLIVGTFIIIYMVLTTVAETAQSGIPFGRRFNKAWAPIRIVLFFALLLPITFGLNSAQYITLTSAKLGSGMASQGWLLYNDVIATSNSTLTGKKEQNIAILKKEDLNHLPAFMMTARTCAFSYDNNYNSFQWANGRSMFPTSWASGVKPWAIYKDNAGQWISQPAFGSTIQTLAQNSEGRDIHVVFGYKDPTIYQRYRGAVAPVCGALVFKVTDISSPGSAIIQTTYYEVIQSLWLSTPNYTHAGPLAAGNLYTDFTKFSEEYAKDSLNIYDLHNPNLPPPGNYKSDWEAHFKKLMEGDGTGANGVIFNAIQAELGNAKTWQVPAAIRDLGWAGAGIWYNRIAEQNGALVSAIRNTPVPVIYARIMEENKAHNKAENVLGNPNEQFRLVHSDESPVTYGNQYEKGISDALTKVYAYWNKTDGGSNPNTSKTGNAFLDIVNLVLGTQGLFELCRNTDIHPLAQLSAVGKSMIDNSIKAFGGTALFTLFGIAPVFQQTSAAMSSFFGTVASVGLMLGFVLFYVLPFMPFIYFFFAVGAWVKTIFEAMVGLPLWALAHLRIDGEGIMGDAAMNGYYLIFEIFIRPILIIFGLIASIVVFAVMVKALNQVFYLVVSNLSGHDPVASAGGCFNNPTTGGTPDQVIPIAHQQAQLGEAYRGPVDEFFFTIIYAITVYIIGTSCEIRNTRRQSVWITNRKQSRWIG